METSRTNRPGLRITLAAFVAASIGAISIPAVTAAAGGRTCFGKHPTILGTQGNDTLHGTTGSDVIVSLGGNDHITAGQGNDYICAGPGNDNVHGAEDVNHMNGGPGNDWLDGRRGPGNVAIGAKGDDLIQAEGKIAGGDGDDTIYSFGYQSPGASPLADVTGGGGGKDLIHGGGNAELLKGGARSDKLYGEAGDDGIDGGSGTDTCDQGPGTGTLTNCP